MTLVLVPRFRLWGCDRRAGDHSRALVAAHELQHQQDRLDNFQWVVGSLVALLDSMPT